MFGVRNPDDPKYASLARLAARSILNIRMSTRPVILLDGAASAPPEVLGHKGHGIDMMRRNGLPVPPAFCITAEVGARYRAEPEATIDAIWDDVLDGMRTLEAATSRTFGRGPRPLLVSVRSGAAVSMPGMMDTLLDLGFSDAVEKALAAEGSAEFARDTRRRFTESYPRIVTGPAPDDPYLQLRAAIEAVFASWDSPRAVAYRSHHGLDDRGGTAVVVQAMVFGNLNANSGAGVMFSRNPMTGANDEFGEWLPGGQGDDVVSGTVDVEPIAALRDQQPAVYDELISAASVIGAADGGRAGDRVHHRGRHAVAAADPGGEALGAGRGATGAAAAETTA